MSVHGFARCRPGCWSGDIADAVALGSWDMVGSPGAGVGPLASLILLPSDAVSL